MTLPNERVNAALAARKLLLDLCDRTYRPRWSELRERARRVLKHHPGAYELAAWGDEERAEARVWFEEDHR